MYGGAVSSMFLHSVTFPMRLLPESAAITFRLCRGSLRLPVSLDAMTFASHPAAQRGDRSQPLVPWSLGIRPQGCAFHRAKNGTPRRAFA